jgi:hypothetical protein
MGVEPLWDLATNEEPEWPSVQRSIHDKGQDWRRSAWLGWSQNGDSYTLIRGFRIGAELLAAYVRETGAAQDSLIFPVVNCWRQHIELTLKCLIAEAELLHDVEGRPPTGHDLMALWKRFRRTVTSGATEEEFGNVERVIMELHAIDPIGEAFRYATSKNGSPTLPTVEQLSLESVGSAFAAVANFLDAADTQISTELDAKAEALAVGLYV